MTDGRLVPATPTALASILERAELWTLSRLVMAGFVFGLIGSERYLGGLAVFGLASLTDALDGYFARVLNQSTPIGRQLDPLVDKVLVSGGFIYLLTVPGTGLAPWMVTVIVVRELLIQWVRSLLEGRGEAFGAIMAGKLKTLFQCLSIVAILLFLGVGLSQNSPWRWVRDAITWIAVGLTIYSGFGYMARAWLRLQKETTPPTH